MGLPPAPFSSSPPPSGTVPFFSAFLRSLGDELEAEVVLSAEVALSAARSSSVECSLNATNCRKIPHIVSGTFSFTNSLPRRSVALQFGRPWKGRKEDAKRMSSKSIDLYEEEEEEDYKRTSRQRQRIVP